MTDKSADPRPRRSAGMLKNPHQAQERAISPTPPVLKPQIRAEPVSSSRHPKPKLLMGEVAMPIATSGGAGQEIARQRAALRAFMLGHRLTPSGWAHAAGVAPGEVLAFLAGSARAIAPATLDKLAEAAGCTARDLIA